ncbi:MAG: DNA polymerase I, partial [Thermoleophilaceae bacterium]|nr:DNA polymerase I [Thermoleophilaceae bacterium]
RNVEFDFDLQDAMARTPDRSRLREFFREFELRDPLRRLEEALGEEGAAPAEQAPVELRARAVESPVADLARLEGDHPTLAAERGEGTLRFAAYAGGEEATVGDAGTLAALELAWGERPLTAHDWKSVASGTPGAASSSPSEDRPALALEHDTMVAAYLLDPARRRYPLADLSAEEGIGACVDEDGAPPELRELAERALVVRALAERQRERLADRGLERLFRDVELPLVDVLVDMEHAGVKLDTERLAEVGETFAERIAGLERDIWELAGQEFTIGSPQQLSRVLFEELGLSRKRRGKTGFSTDARVLAAIRGEHPVIERIESWRELTKLKSTYLDALPELVDPHTKRLHTTFNQTATTTGRLSSTNPNLQNVPIRTEIGRGIRACFVAEPGHRLISADYSQVELRLLAHIAGEDVLKEIFRRGEDVHAATAAEIFDLPPGEIDPGIRSRAKMVNFGIVYGLQPFGLSDRLQIPIEEAEEFIERYLSRFPSVRRFIDETIGRATADGYVTTLFGRSRSIPELRERSYQQRELGKRLAVNTVIQGTAADIIKVAMVRCRGAIHSAGLATRIVLQIHDELLFEAPEDEVERASEIVDTEMAGAFELDPPLAVDVGVGANWLEAK